MPESAPPVLAQPSLAWRTGSSITMGFIGFLSRAFMYGASRPEVHGADKFLQLLDERKDVAKRRRGLITVSNHISVVDDPLVFAPLPFSYHFNPSNHRWSLGSYDICFKNSSTSVLTKFFSLGQVLPAHRQMHSKHGGLFQPTVTQAVRLLSRQPFTVPPYHPPTTFPSLDTFPYPSPPISTLPASSVTTTIPSDPFTDSSLTYPHTYTTTGNDIFPAPSSFSAHRYSWVHIFPEGRVHQHPHKTMRYFKWGVARLILEPDVLPDIVPVWIEGNDEVMHEARTFPRFLPRVGKKLGVWFGDNVGGQTLEAKPFHELRARWRMLVERERRITGRGQREVGELTEELKYGEEAVQLRIECTKRVREEVLKVRRLRGLEDEDPKEGLVETWIEEGGRMDGEMDDGSFVKDM